jgi:hypothetical protein
MERESFDIFIRKNLYSLNSYFHYSLTFRVPLMFNAILGSWPIRSTLSSSKDRVDSFFSAGKISESLKEAKNVKRSWLEKRREYRRWSLWIGRSRANGGREKFQFYSGLKNRRPHSAGVKNHSENPEDPHLAIGGHR